MSMTVQCQCGTKFEIYPEDRVYRANGHYTDSLMGKEHCPNPDCDQTIYANANVYSGVAFDEDERNPKIYWDEIEVGHRITYDSRLYDVVLKRVYKVTSQRAMDTNHNLLYLQGVACDEKIVVEVRNSNFLSVFEGMEIKYFTKGTIMWKEMWKEDDLKGI